jgi:aspartate racemase
MSGDVSGKMEGMKVIGLIGGMSWESTAVYYQQINHAVRRRFGGLHSARVVLHSCDFDEIVTLQRQGRWDILGDTLADAARSLEKAGADCLAICTNTMHKVAQEVQSAVNIPLIDIRDATGAAVRADHIRKVGLLGTQYTMEQSFFRDHLTQEWNLEVVTPTERMRGVVHNMIFGELCQGNVLSQNRSELLTVIDELAAHGAEGIILGCTELMLLLNQDHCAQPLYDTTTLHAEALVAYALDEHQSVPLWTPMEIGAFEAVLI